MPPQVKEVAGVENVARLKSDHEHEEGDPLHCHERTLEFNLQGIIDDLRNLDYSKVVWRNVILFVLLHAYSVYGAYLAVTCTQWKTWFFSFGLYFFSCIGVTAGNHRLWSHKAFKAKAPLRVFLTACQTLAFQNDVYEWSRDHRVHHKYSETDADPHNANRGLFFAHMGWLMYKKHPDVIAKGKMIDMSDLAADPILQFQRRHYKPLVIFACFVMPTFVPWYFWNETFLNALMVAGFLRYTVGLHITWFVNSLAHWVGSKPFDQSIYPSQNAFVSAVTMGEGWHNFHHVFPYDYRTSEFGGLFNINFMTTIIEFFAFIGQAYDLKTADRDSVAMRALRTGDGTHRRTTKLE